MDTRTVVLAIVGAAILALTHALDKKLPRFKSISDGARVVLASALGVVSSAIDVMSQDAAMNLQTAFLNALAISGPSFVVIFVSWLAGDGTPGDQASPDKPSKPPTRLALDSITRSFKCAVCAITAFAVVTMTGCAGGLSPVLNEVVTDVSDAAQILNVIRSVVTIFFLSHPSPDSQMKVEEALVRAQLALDAALRATNGAKDLTQKDTDAAFADFKVAYEDLVKTLKSMGIADQSGKLAAAKGSTAIVLPLPLALKR